jgi:hypothetical protein
MRTISAVTRTIDHRHGGNIEAQQSSGYLGHELADRMGGCEAWPLWFTNTEQHKPSLFPGRKHLSAHRVKVDKFDVGVDGWMADFVE